MAGALENLLVKRLLEKQSLKTEYVLFVDMLGFSDLTTKHPGTLTINEDEEGIVSSSTSASMRQFDIFHYLLDRVALERFSQGALAPHRMMMFSDCAFLLYEHALQAALSATALMREFVHAYVPVRMGLAYGTCHPIRTGDHTEGDFHITRAVFYGTAIVRAHEAEAKSGSGLRIFVHDSIDDKDRAQIEERVPVRPLPASEPGKTPPSRFELCYLAVDKSRRMATALDVEDKRLRSGLQEMWAALDKDAHPEVRKQYTQTLDAMNRMREYLERKPFDPLA